jgi:Fic family protein
MQWNWQLTDWPNWQFDSQKMTALEAEFMLTAGRLLGAWQHLQPDHQDQVKVELLSNEAVLTSAIEGEYLDRDSVRSSIKRQFGLNAPKGGSPAEIGMAELMVACFEEYAEPLTHQTLFDWHKLICRGRSSIKIGAYRSHEEPMQVVSGALGKEKVHFEAPPSCRMSDEMTTFLEWFANTKTNGQAPLSPLIRAGLIHLYFVTIHPFEDGNGRMARALSEKALAQALGQPSLLALSTQIELDKKRYYAALEASNKTLDCTDWLIWFGKTVIAAQAHSLSAIDLVIFKTQLFDRLRGQLNSRQEKVLNRLFNAEPDGFKGGLSAKNYMTMTTTSPATARRDLADLVKKKVLRRTGERKSTRYWLNL